MILAHPPVVGFAAPSGTGKTTLLTRLIPLLKSRGLRVGLIKKTHHSVEIDQPGKDSHTLRIAGASPVMLSASGRRAVIMEHSQAEEPTLEDELTFFPVRDVDVILVEGFRHEDFPKIELHRATLGSALMFPEDNSVIAVATDQPDAVDTGLPVLDLNDPPQIAEFIWRRFFHDANG